MDGFVFIAIESEHPHLAAAYELTPRAVAEGRVKIVQGRCLINGQPVTIERQ